MIERLGFIYGLVDPRTDEVRYIGKSMICPWGRYRKHLFEALSENKAGHKCNWIRHLDGIGLRPKLLIIEQEVEEDEINDRERWWVLFGRSCGWDLTNGTTGGEGSVRWSSDSKENLRQALRGRQFSEAHIEALRKASTGRRHSPETIAKIVAKNKGRKLSPEHREAFSQYWTGKTHSDEHRRKVSEAKKGTKLSAEARQKISDAAKNRVVSDETKAKIAQSTKDKKRSEETKRRMSEAAKRRWARQREEVV
jgi:NUMOD3 motif